MYNGVGRHYNDNDIEAVFALHYVRPQAQTPAKSVRRERARKMN